MTVQGAKAGSKKQRQPYIERDSLRSIAYAKILYAVGEGEVSGLVDGLRSVMLDGTPLMSQSGNMNFQNVAFEFRPGTLEQDFIAGFPEVNNEAPVNIELRSESPWIRAINNTELDAFRLRFRFPSLQEAKPNGDIVGYAINFAIDLSTDGGAYQTVLTESVSGKTTSGYERTYRIDLPDASDGWQVRVRRITPNQNSSLVSDTMMIDAFTEIIDAKLRYPNTVLAALIFDSSQFSNIPKASFRIKGKIIKVPSNYNPEDRSYVGVWDGTFKLAYTNNPAWVWYDIVLNPRYGLGNRIDASLVNKWELYKIAQWCDQMVDDGKGGVEPRFTCNVCIQQQEEAYTVLNDLSSIFHGMSYWDGSQMVCIADMPTDPVYNFSRANIIDGIINYTGTSRKDRHSVAMVAWDDPSNNYQTKKEPVWNTDYVKTLGVQPLEVGAVGCTSAGQAVRAGKWSLITEQKETRSATFRVGLDGCLPRPGEIIKLSDALLAGRVNGGRIISATSQEVVIDQLAIVRVGDTLTVNLPSGKNESKTVQKVNGRKIKLSSSFSEVPENQAVWVVDSEDLTTMSFRIISITKPEETQYEIIAVQHSQDKFLSIDTGAVIDDKPTTVIPPSVQPPPDNVLIKQNVMIDQGLAVTNMNISWDAAENAVAYRVEWKRDNVQWVTEPITGGQSIDIKGVYSGQYLARVFAINALGAVSIPSVSMLTDITGKTGKPPQLAFLNATSILFGIQLKWGFPQDSADTQRTEIEYSKTSDGADAIKLGDFAYPQDSHTMQGLAAGQRFWFRGRLVDRTGNIGDWSTWIEGVASNDASDILDMIEGEISETQLSGELLEKIDSGGGAATEIKEIKDDLAAMITLKTQLTVDGKEYLAGIGVGVENHDGITQSQVLIAADRFAIIHPNGAETSVPFVIQDNNVYINSAFIADATITMAKISGALQSDNYISGQQGWRLDKAGNLEFNGSVAGGGRLNINNQTVRVYDGNGRLRVRLGIW